MRNNFFGLFHLIYYNVCFFDKKIIKFDPNK